MTPEQAAALWNELVWSEFGKMFFCVRGINHGIRIQEEWRNDSEDLDEIVGSVEEWAIQLRAWVEIEKTLPQPDKSSGKRNSADKLKGKKQGKEKAPLGLEV